MFHKPRMEGLADSSGKCNRIKPAITSLGVYQPSVFLGRWSNANSICSICSFDTSSTDDDFGRY